MLVGRPSPYVLSFLDAGHLVSDIFFIDRLDANWLVSWLSRLTLFVFAQPLLDGQWLVGPSLVGVNWLASADCC